MDSEDEGETEKLVIQQTTSILTWLGCILLVLLVIVCLMVAIMRLAHGCFSPQLRKHVLIMRNNILYHNESKDSTISTGSSTVPLVPRLVKAAAAAAGSRPRMSSELTLFSEYEIPLDAQWELSRER